MKGSSDDARTVRAAWSLAAGALVTGVLYYACVRTSHPPHVLAALFEGLPWRTGLPDPTGGTLPSFLHAVTFAAAAIALGRRRAPLPLLCGAALLVPLALEGLLGTPDPLDVLALFAGAAVATLVLRARPVVARRGRAFGAPSRTAFGTVPGAASHAPSDTTPSGATGARSVGANGSRSGGAASALALLVASAALAAGSTYVETPGCALYDEDGLCSQTKRFATPLYMDKASLRAAVRVEPARPLDRIGQLHAVGTWLFVGERNRGVHVIDNADPAVPENVGFIRVPGNTEVVVRGTHLYADSYVDLVTLDVSDPANVRVVDRQQDIFPFDAFQNVPYDIAFRYGSVDRSRGVVVGYVEE